MLEKLADKRSFNPKFRKRVVCGMFMGVGVLLGVFGVVFPDPRCCCAAVLLTLGYVVGTWEGWWNRQNQIEETLDKELYR